MFERRLIEHNAAAQQSGQRLPRHIIRRRSEPAADKDDVHARERGLDGLTDGGHIVPDGGVANQVEAQRADALAPCLGVTVERAATEQFRSRGDEFDGQGHFE